MRKIIEVLRLHHEGGLSHREIARAISASPTTVGEILRRAKQCGVTWPLPAALSEAGLEAQLYPPTAPSSHARPEPDWPAVHRELRRKGVTLDLLWQEYKAEQPDGYRYSSFCEHYRQWAGRLSASLRQTHAPGEKLFIDYAGPTVPIVDPMSGEIRQAAIFAAVLGASNYTYCEATWSQALHTRYQRKATRHRIKLSLKARSAAWPSSNAVMASTLMLGPKSIATTMMPVSTVRR